MAPRKIADPPRTKILVVEDDPFMAEVMSDVLDSGGYAVEHAATGAEAREKVEQSRPDLVMLDLILPDMDGLILCNDIRRTTDVPIMVVSGTNRKRDAVLSLRLGADDFVAKPFDVAELEERVKTVLRRAA
jgi:DNA-binding response OmpR family regulator